MKTTASIPTQGSSEGLEPTADQPRIKQVILDYFTALAAADVPTIGSYYATDGVVIPAGGQSAVGQEQLKSTYEQMFNTVALNLNVSIGEIVVDDELAFATSHSAGTTIIRSTGQTVAVANRELFVFTKADGQWKIARYMFNQAK